MQSSGGDQRGRVREESERHCPHRTAAARQPSPATGWSAATPGLGLNHDSGRTEPVLLSPALPQVLGDLIIRWIPEAGEDLPDPARHPVGLRKFPTTADRL